jgi:hypothetical protein
MCAVQMKPVRGPVKESVETTFSGRGRVPYLCYHLQTLGPTQTPIVCVLWPFPGVEAAGA